MRKPNVRCIWCSVPQGAQDRACRAPDGDGHMFSVPDERSPLEVYNAGLAAGVAQGRERMLAVVEWATGRGCGLSSETMLRASFGLPVSGHIPWDVSDFGRCYGMLRALPWVRESFPAIAKLSPAWADYIENWAALEAAYESEQGQRNCHKTWAIIQGIVARHDARRTP